MTLELGKAYTVTTTFGRFSPLMFLMRHVPCSARVRGQALFVFERPNHSWFEVQVGQFVDAKEIE